MESKRHRRRPYEAELHLETFFETNEAKASKPNPISRASIVIAAIGVIVTIAWSIYLYVVARDAMAGPGLDLPIDQVYIQRCGSCHAAPPAEEFSKWGPRDWSRMLPLTMFMPGEQDQ